MIVLRFDSDQHLEAWMASPQRQGLLQEASAFEARTRVRKVRGGFDSWFTSGTHAARLAPPAWKQNMLILLVLYPVVFLFGEWVQTPLLVDQGVAFWLALFIGNAVSVFLLGWLLVPQANRLFSWWLDPVGHDRGRVESFGLALIALLYGVCLLVFSTFP